MNNEIGFRILLFLLFFGFIAHRSYYTRKSSPPDDRIKEERENVSILKIIEILSLVPVVATMIYMINPQWMSWSSLEFPVWMRWSGLVTAIAGFGLLQWAQITLGKNWSDTPVLLKEHHLVQDGPYRHIRHPIYTAFLLVLLSYMLLSANWFIGLSWLATSFVDIALRIRYEEGLMLRQFGEEYTTYMQKTGRILPYL